MASDGGPGVLFRVGDRVRITWEGLGSFDSGRRVVDGVVSLASENGRSLLLAFEALLGGYLGQMPVRWDSETGGFRALLDEAPVGLERVLASGEERSVASLEAASGEERSAASLEAERVLRSLLTKEKGFRAGVVVLSYRRPGAEKGDVSFGQASALRDEEGALDFVMLSKALRQIADQLDAVVAHPERLVPKG